MADVKKYTEQIANAKKGKDVRASIVAAINEVSDENNLYNQTKEDILEAKKEFDQQAEDNKEVQQAFDEDVKEAQKINSDLQGKIQKGTELSESLQKKIKSAETEAGNLQEKIQSATTLDTNLGKKNTTAEQLDGNLQKKIEAGNTLHEDLKADITAAGQAEKSLEADITAAGQAEKSLEVDVTAAGKAEESLEEDIVVAGQRQTALQGLVETADQTEAELEEDIAAAEKTNETLIETANEKITLMQQESQKQINMIKENGGGVENALSNYFALRRTGKIFSTKIYKYETSSSPVGERLNDSVGLACTPSEGSTAGVDDFAQFGLFHHFTCNWSVDENGFNHVDALQGQIGFSKKGKVQVGEVTMSGWFGIEDISDAIIYHYSDKQSSITPHPMKESINPDGTISPFMIHAKYIAGDIDGAPYSSFDLSPASGCQAVEAKNPVSYSGMINYMHKLGPHYCGMTSWDLFYVQLMFIIKYCTVHSQSVMAGCTSYSHQYMAVVEETGVTRIILPKAQAEKFAIGSTVSLGELGENTNKDRYNAHLHNLAYSVKVLKVEAVDDTNSAVYVDTPTGFDTTLTTCISTMPWKSGSTDEVPGSDGSAGDNKSGIYPFKLQGIECSVGAYTVLGNVVMDIVTGQDGNPVRDVYVCDNATLLSGTISAVKEKYKKAKSQIPYTAATWKYISEETTEPNIGMMIPTKVGAGSTTRFADGVYTDTGTSGQREWLAFGHLHGGASAGLWLLSASYGLTVAHWLIVSGVSPNGTRGEYQATA